MNYSQASLYLDSFLNLEKIPHYNYSEKLNLDRMQALLDNFGSPQNKFKAVHIAGSKGKGTTAAALYQILKTHGVKAGLYTSPHLLTFRERIRVSTNITEDPLNFGDTISDEELSLLVEKVKPKLDEFSKNSKWGEPTFFEVFTLLAFLYFAEREVDLAVLETGLGGRLDAANICRPVLTVITKILFEHTDKLGKTIEEIAGEKAGILKQSVPCVIGLQKWKSALEVIRKKAEELNIPVFALGEDAAFNMAEGSFSIRIAGYEYDNLRTNLLGNFQLENLAVSAACAHLLKKYFPLSDDKIREALLDIYWPGRMQVINENPQIVLDAAHTPESIKVLGEELRGKFSSQEVITILAISSDKDIENIIREADSFSDELIFTDIDNPRLSSKSELLSIAQGAGAVNCIEADFYGLTEKIFKDKNKDKIFLITGSIFLVSEALRVFRNGAL